MRVQAIQHPIQDWTEALDAVVDSRYYPGPNRPGKPRVFMPYLGFPAYVTRCNEVVENGYEGFALER